MKFNARKALMKSLQAVGVADFKSDEELLMAKALFGKMVEGDEGEGKPKRKKRTPAPDGPKLVIKERLSHNG